MSPIPGNSFGSIEAAEAPFSPPSPSPQPTRVSKVEQLTECESCNTWGVKLSQLVTAGSLALFESPVTSVAFVDACAVSQSLAANTIKNSVRVQQLCDLIQTLDTIVQGPVSRMGGGIDFVEVLSRVEMINLITHSHPSASSLYDKLPSEGGTTYPLLKFESSFFTINQIDDGLMTRQPRRMIPSTGVSSNRCTS